MAKVKYEKGKDLALRWHFGIIANPPSEPIGREYLVQVLPQYYVLVDGQLAMKKTGQLAKAKELATDMKKAKKSFLCARASFAQTLAPTLGLSKNDEDICPGETALCNEPEPKEPAAKPAFSKESKPKVSPEDAALSPAGKTAFSKESKAKEPAGKTDFLKESESKESAGKTAFLEETKLKESGREVITKTVKDLEGLSVKTVIPKTAPIEDEVGPVQEKKTGLNCFKSCGLAFPDAGSSAFDYQLAFLSGSRSKSGNNQSQFNSYLEQLRTVPLFSGNLLDGVKADTFQQYGLLGEQLASQHPSNSGEEHLSLTKGDPRVFLNVNTPWSAFICGSQGSGKSHTLSCMLENCLISSKLGQLSSPLTALVFHYDVFTSYASNQVCEAAYLCSSGIPVRVLVSPTNYWRMKHAYENLPGLAPDAPRPEVIPLKFQDRHLDATKIMTMMAVNDQEGSVPLYIEVVLRILRQMAIESRGAPGLDYDVFRKKLDDESFTSQQNGPLRLRLDLLESFMDRSLKAGEAKHLPEHAKGRINEQESGDRTWKFEPGSLTIVDLSCPFVNDNAACSLFNICLELFLESRGSGSRIVALDEAHKFMKSSASATIFAEKLLQVIRQQRHLAARVIIATQEPTISPKLLDLSTMTIVHRFTSPEWLRALRDHLAGVRTLGETGNTETNARHDVDRIFREIVELGTGEALLFSPAAMLKRTTAAAIVGTDDGTRLTTPGQEMLPEKLGIDWVKIRVRKRLTEDGGRSIMAV